jgi:hypothetical protein
MYISAVVGSSLRWKTIIFKPEIRFYPGNIFAGKNFLQNKHSVWEYDGLIGSLSSI